MQAALCSLVVRQFPDYYADLVVSVEGVVASSAVAVADLLPQKLFADFVV